MAASYAAILYEFKPVGDLVLIGMVVGETRIDNGSAFGHISGDL